MTIGGLALDAGWRTAALASSLAAALWIALLIAEGRRRGGWRWARMAASTVLVLSLLALVLRPARLSAPPPAGALLLTPGATPALLAAAGIEPAAQERVLSLAPGFVAAGGASVETLPDAATLRRRYPEVDRLRLAGHGLRAWDWQALDGVAAALPAPAPVQPGIGRAHWPRQLPLGLPFEVAGSVAGAPAGGVLELAGPGGVEATQALAGAAGEAAVAARPFALRAWPKDRGRFLYRLRLRGADGAVVADEVLGVEVVAPAPVAVLWLEASPSFETRHLKTWLAARGGALAVRTTISRDRFRYEYLNHPEVALRRLERALFNRFDLVVADRASLAALGGSARQALSAAVADDGVGLLVRLDQGDPASPLPRLPWTAFAAQTIEELDTLAVRAVLPGAAASTPLTVAPRHLADAPGVEPLVLDTAGRALAARRPRGAGWVAVTLLDDTFRWVLEGHPEHHGALWRRLLEGVARGRPSARWQLPPGPLLVDQPLPLTLETPEPAVATVRFGEGDSAGQGWRLALRQGPHAGGRFFSTLWPRTAGWHQLQVDDQPPFAFYVQPAECWQAWQQTARLDATRDRLAARAAIAAGAAPAAAPRPVPLARWPAFVAFLLASALLWGDERLRRGAGW